VPPDQQVQQVQLDRQVQQVQPVPLDLSGLKAPWALLVQLGLPEVKVHRVQQVLLAHPESKVKRVRQARPVQQVRLDPRVQQVRLDPRVQQVPLEFRDQLDLQVLQVRLAQRDRPGQPAALALREFLEQKEVGLDPLDPPDLRDRLALWAMLALPVRKVRWVHQVTRDLLVHKVQLDFKD
jgi:hypothetical protein